MRIDQFTFGSIRVDGVVYERDVVIARGRVRKRKKKSSKPSSLRCPHSARCRVSRAIASGSSNFGMFRSRDSDASSFTRWCPRTI